MIRIVLAGTPLSGRLTTLRCLGRLARPVFTPRTTPFSADGGWHFTFGNTAISLRGVFLGPHVHDLEHVTNQTDRDDLAFIRTADAGIFVVDAQPARAEANEYSLREFANILVSQGRSPTDLPLVFQVNKQDLAEEETVKRLDWPFCTYVSTVAVSCTGAEAVLDAVRKLASEGRS